MSLYAKFMRRIITSKIKVSHKSPYTLSFSLNMLAAL